MNINPSPLRFAEAGLHTVPLVRRIAASLAGAVIALSAHSVYQDTTAALIASAHADTKPQLVLPATREDKIAQQAQLIKIYAQKLKQDRAALSH